MPASRAPRARRAPVISSSRRPAIRRSFIRPPAAFALFLGAAAARSGRAQSLGTPPGYREYLSLLGTPIASLPPLATYTFFGIAQRSPEVVARYGYVPDITRPLAPATGGHASRSLGSFGLSGVIPAGLGATLSLTAGVSNEHCNGCSGSAFMASLGGDYRITSISIDASSALRLTIGVNGELGYGHPAAGTTWSGDVGIPLAFRLGDNSGTSIIPFVTPSFALVATSATASAGEVRAGRPLIGAGVALFNPKSALGASVGFQYVFVSNTQLQLGVALSLGGR